MKYYYALTVRNIRFAWRFKEILVCILVGFYDSFWWNKNNIHFEASEKRNWTQIKTKQQQKQLRFCRCVRSKCYFVHVRCIFAYLCDAMWISFHYHSSHTFNSVNISIRLFFDIKRNFCCWKNSGYLEPGIMSRRSSTWHVILFYEWFPCLVWWILLKYATITTLASHLIITSCKIFV